MYLVFMGDAYYPLGGWKDYKGSFPTIEIALAYVASNEHDWYQIVDLATSKLIGSKV